MQSSLSQPASCGGGMSISVVLMSCMTSWKVKTLDFRAHAQLRFDNFKRTDFIKVVYGFVVENNTTCDACG